MTQHIDISIHTVGEAGTRQEESLKTDLVAGVLCMLLCGGAAGLGTVAGFCCLFRPRDGQILEPALPLIPPRAQEEQRLVCVRPELDACTDIKK